MNLGHLPAVKISPKPSPLPSPKQSPHPSPERSPKVSPFLDVSPKLEPATEGSAAEHQPELTAETSADMNITVVEPLVIKTSPKSSPASSTRSSPSPKRYEAEKILQEIDAKFGDTSTVQDTERIYKESVRPEFEVDSAVTVKQKSTRKFDTPVVKQEIEEYMSEVAPSTPTRSRRNRRESSSEVMTPKRSSRRLREKEENQQVEAQTPTRSSRRGKKDENTAAAPTRLGEKKNTEEAENAEVIKVETPKPFSRRAKEAVQESLKQLAGEMELKQDLIAASQDEKNISRSPSRSVKQVALEASEQKQKVKATPKKSKTKDSEEMDVEDESPLLVSQRGKETAHESKGKLTEEDLDTIREREQKTPDDSSPNRLTRIKKRDRGSMSPGPSELVQHAQVAVTPTRSSRRLAEKENQKENEESTVRTPTRGKRGRKTIDTAQSPAVERKVTDKLITPFRGRGKKSENLETIEELPVKVPKSPSRSKTTISPDGSLAENKDNVAAAQTPTRGRRKKKEDKLNETGDVSLIETAAVTPIRRSSRVKKQTEDALQESFVQADINLDNEFLDTDSDGPRTRRRSFGRTDKISEKFDGDVQNIRRQSFSKSLKSKVDILNADIIEGSKTRRHTIGVSELKIDSEKLSDLDQKSSDRLSPVREQTKVPTPVTTPSRRGRPKKKDVSPIPESVEGAENDSEITSDTGTPSRKGRRRKVKEMKDIKSKPDTVEEKGDDKEMILDKDERKESTQETKPGGTVEPEPKRTPSRTKRQKVEKKESAPASPEKEIISQSFAALVEGKIFKDVI